VSLVSIVRPLGEYRANYTNYSRGAILFASIDPLADNAGNSTLRFLDLDGDGNLSVGDEFHVAYNGAEVLRLVYTPGPAIVGFWPTPP